MAAEQCNIHGVHGRYGGKLCLEKETTNRKVISPGKINVASAMNLANIPPTEETILGFAFSSSHFVQKHLSTLVRQQADGSC